MLLLKTLEVMMSKYTTLKNNIKRSEIAYQVYCKNKNYHHALHIFNANKIIYDELNDLLKERDLSNRLLELIVNYLFHLEDWFLQFSVLEREVDSPQQTFSFLPLDNSIPYPSEFLEVIKK